MTPNQAVYLISFIVSLALFGIGFFLSKKQFDRTGNAQFSFLQYFPFELNPFRKRSAYSYLYPVLTIGGSLGLMLCSVAFVFETNSVNGALTPSIIFSIVLFIGLLSFIALNFIKLSALKAHLVFVVLFVMSVLMLNVLYGFYFLNFETRFARDTKDVVRIIASGIAVLNVIFQLVLILNKNFKNWAKLVQMDADTYVRPKFAYLPVVEWGNFLSLLITFVPLGIMLYF